jgi:hypothetical protein
MFRESQAGATTKFSSCQVSESDLDGSVMKVKTVQKDGCRGEAFGRSAHERTDDGVVAVMMAILCSTRYLLMIIFCLFCFLWDKGMKDRDAFLHTSADSGGREYVKCHAMSYFFS